MSNRVWIGTIESLSDAGIDFGKWLELIDSYSALAHVPPRMGTNPLTRQPCEYRAPATTAIVRENDLDVGSIQQALDGSPFLNVYAGQESIDFVVSLAAEIAAALAGKFVRAP